MRRRLSAMRGRAVSLAPALSVLAAAVMLAACGSTPTADQGQRPADVPPKVAGGPMGDFELAQFQRAKDLEQKGQLAEAAWTWEVLTVLKPDDAGYRERLKAVQGQIDAAVAERMQKAQQAQSKGDWDGATQHYLTVLSLQPDNTKAADALRGVERDRNKKAYLGTPSRITLRRGTSEPKPTVTAQAKSGATKDAAKGAAKDSKDGKDAAAPVAKAAAGKGAAPTARQAETAVAAAPAGQDRNELEHIAMLSAQGEVDEAIALMERRSAQDRRDPSARRLLADLYVRKAERVAANDRAGAINWLQKCLKIDDKHPRALALMRQWIDASAAPAGGGGGKGSASVGTAQRQVR